MCANPISMVTDLVSGIFGGPSSKAPLPPTPTPAPTTDSAAVQAAAEAERRRRLNATGRSKTIVTGSLGDTSTANVGKKTLLGQ